MRGTLSIRRTCQLLALPRSSHYAKLQPKPAHVIEPQLEKTIRALHKEHRCALGSRGFVKALKREGINIGRHRMRGLMKTLELVRRKRRYGHYKRNTKLSNVAPNILARQFNPTTPNTIWAGDITYIRVGGSWLYLAIVMDLYSRRIVGWGFSRTPDTDLSLKALQLAVGIRKPSSELMFHSDQGCQYTADRFVNYLATQDITQSMSRRGNCWDNAVVERYFRTLKHDWQPEEGYTNHFEAEKDVMDFIYHHNHRRCHTAADNLPPAVFEKLAA